MSKAVIKIDPVDDAMIKDNPTLASAVNGYLAATFPDGIEKVDRLWVCYSVVPDAFRIIGVFGCANRPDFSLYHIEQGTSKQEKWEGMKAHELMFNRCQGFAADTFGHGTKVLFRIDPEAEEHWKSFIEETESKRANRFIIEV